MTKQQWEEIKEKMDITVGRALVVTVVGGTDHELNYESDGKDLIWFRNDAMTTALDLNQVVAVSVG